ncbi:ABC transporter permease [Halovenus marina]|uniref:ABC transporter permease n=1 Tax=Halovenus marina TaxID=3396621 RepID=UPI003F56D967
MSMDTPNLRDRVRRALQSEGRFGKVLRRFFQNRIAVAGLVLTVLYFAVGLLGPILAPHDPTAIDATARFQPPSLEHPFGTDTRGRDILSRVMHGARLSLYVAAVVVTVAGTVGVTLGLIAGYFRGLVDEAIMRFVDVLFAFPAILLALVIITILGPGLNKAIVALSIAFVPIMVRVTRGSAISIREEEYITAAKAYGETSYNIMFREMLPNLISVVMVQATITFAFSILAEAGLSYLGLSAQFPTITWGLMISEGQNNILRAPWSTIFPGLAIMVSVLGLTFFGVGLRDALDPKTDVDTEAGGGL